MLNLLKKERMKKLIMMSLMAFFCLTTISAQKTVVSKKNQKVYDVVEKMPQYPGGMVALFEFLEKNLKYPADAQKQKVEGRVIVSFIVETDGSISDINIVRKVFPSLDEEAVRLLGMMPRWSPGLQNGKPVRVKYAIPITYSLK